MTAPRIQRRTAAAIAVAGTVGTAVAVQRRHLRTLSRDPVYARLTAPLDGRALSLRSADGTPLHAESFGPEDGDTLILGHGWTEQLRYWGPVVERLNERGLRVVAYDLRGHGSSGPAAGHDYSLQRFGEDLEAVLAAAVGEGERATVVGHSLGAMSIAAWAEHHNVRARVRAAALLNTGFGDLVTGHRLFGELAAKWLNNPWASELVLGSSAPLPGFSSPAQQWLLRYCAFGPGARAGDVAFYERMLLECPPDVRSACAKAMFEMDLWEAVTRLDVPTLVLTGTDDRLTPPAHSERIAEALPDLAALVELPRTGHMSPLERPDEVSRALAELVDRTRTPTSAARA
ncbi:MAG: alpha/beta hydrolase [Solirubrobacteraceae bacterium]